MQYNQRRSLASHTSPRVRRKQWNISLIKMHLMPLFSTTFPTHFKRFTSISNRTTFLKDYRNRRRLPQLSKCRAKPLGNYFGPTEGPKWLIPQINSNPLHLIQGIQSFHTKRKVHFFGLHFHYTHLKSWTDLNAGVLTLQVHSRATVLEIIIIDSWILNPSITSNSNSKREHIY